MPGGAAAWPAWSTQGPPAARLGCWARRRRRRRQRWRRRGRAAQGWRWLHGVLQPWRCCRGCLMAALGSHAGWASSESFGRLCHWLAVARWSAAVVGGHRLSSRKPADGRARAWRLSSCGADAESARQPARPAATSPLARRQWIPWWTQLPGISTLEAGAGRLRRGLRDAGQGCEQPAAAGDAATVGAWRWRCVVALTPPATRRPPLPTTRLLAGRASWPSWRNRHVRLRRAAHAYRRAVEVSPTAARHPPGMPLPCRPHAGKP